MRFSEKVYRRLQALPERSVQEFPADALPPRYRSAAVMLPLWPEEDGGVRVALTRRVDHLPAHRGQVSFPGGSALPEDGSTLATALRETREELGLPPESLQVMGRLDDAWSRYGFHVIPYVGWLERRPEFLPDPNEVAEVLIADLECLLQPGAACLHTWTLSGRERTAQAFRWEGGYVWGLTADILLELLLWVKGEESNRGNLRLENMRKLLEEEMKKRDSGFGTRKADSG